jgi:hypothetical protein
MVDGFLGVADRLGQMVLGHGETWGQQAGGSEAKSESESSTIHNLRLRFLFPLVRELRAGEWANLTILARRYRLGASAGWPGEYSRSRGANMETGLRIRPVTREIYSLVSWRKSLGA